MIILARPNSKCGQHHYYECAEIDTIGDRQYKRYRRCAESKNNYEAWVFMVCTISAEIVTDNYFGYAIDRQQQKTIINLRELPDDIHADLINRLAPTLEDLNERGVTPCLFKSI